MQATTQTNADRFIPVNRKSSQAGCGFRFAELRTYILDTQTNKLVRDIGSAKYSADAAAATALRMNQSHAGDAA